MSSFAEIRTLARRLDRLESAARKTKQPTLGFSSIDDGAITSVDEDQNLKMVFGKQFDGTQTAAVLSGPTPPAPTVPFASPASAGLKVYWDGTFADGQIAPMDFTRITVHAEPLDTFVDFNPLDQTKIVGEFNTARGGEVYVSLTIEEHIVYLVTWTQSGTFSLPSEVDFGTPIPIGGVPTEPPSTSPELEVTGTAEGFLVKAETPPPGTEIEYHVSTTAGFVPDATTLSATTSATTYYAVALPDGSRFETDIAYYWRSIAKNPAGAAEDPSTEIVEFLDPDQISELITGSLVTGFILTGSIQIGQITIDANTGITVPQPSGSPIHIPSDGSAAQFSGSFVTNDLTVETNAVLNGVSTIIGELNLLGGIPNPVAAPEVGPWLFYSQINWSIPSGGNWRGLAFADIDIEGTPKTVAFTTNTHGSPDTVGAAVFQDGGGGDPIASHPLTTGAGAQSYGLTIIGDTVYVLFWHYGIHSLRIHRYNVDVSGGEFVSNGSAINFNLNSSWDTSHVLGIGNDGTNLLIGYRTNSGEIKAERRNKDTGAFVSAQTLDASMDIDSITSINYGEFDFGTEKYVVGQNSHPRRVMVFNPDGSQSTEHHWASITGGAVTWYDGMFIEMNYWGDTAGGNVWKYSPAVTAVTRFYRYTWFDWNEAGGTHETARSPATEYEIPPRGWPHLTAAPAPEANSTEDDAANLVRFYMGDTAETCRSLSLAQPPEEGPPGGRTFFSGAIDSPTETPLAPTDSTFISATSYGTINSALGDGDGPLIRLTGLGEGRVGPLLWDSTGALQRFRCGPEDENDDPLVDFLADGSWRLGDLDSDNTGTAYAMYGLSSQSIPSTAGFTKIAFDSPVSGGAVSTGSGTVTVNKSGIYVLTVGTALSAGGSKVVIRITRNGTPVTSQSDEGGGYRYLSCCATLSLDAGDEIEADINHGDGSSVSLSANYTNLGVTRMVGT